MLSASGNNFKTPLALGLGAALAYRLRCSTSNARSKPPVAKKKPHHVPFGTTAAPLALLGASPTQLAFNTPPASVTMLPTMVPLPERCGPGGHPYGDATSCES